LFKSFKYYLFKQKLWIFKNNWRKVRQNFARK